MLIIIMQKMIVIPCDTLCYWLKHASKYDTLRIKNLLESVYKVNNY